MLVRGRDDGEGRAREGASAEDATAAVLWVVLAPRGSKGGGPHNDDSALCL